MRSMLLSIMFCMISSVSWGETVSWADLVKDPSDNLTYQRFMPEPFTGVASASPEYPVLGLFEDGLKTGTIEFNQQGLRKSKTEYIYFYGNNYLKQSTTCKSLSGKCVKNGEQINYSRPHQLTTKITYKDNQIQHEERFHGNLLSQITIYKNGEAQDNPTVIPLEGTAQFFNYTNGQLSDKGNYEDGEKHGLCEGYYENGKLAYQDDFRDGILYKNGQLASGVFEYFYSEGGQLRLKISYKDGEKHGLYEEYYENGQLKIKWNYKDGEPHGLFEGYYENGMKVSTNPPLK